VEWIVVNSVPEGWYPDPERPSLVRWWDGSAWTEHVQVLQQQQAPLFDAELPVGVMSKKKTTRLVVTPDEVVWGDTRIRWDDVTYFTQLTTVQSGAAISYEMTLMVGEQATKIVYFPKDRRDPNPKRAHDALLTQLRNHLGNRVLRNLLEMLDRGEPIRAGGLLFTPQGWAHEEKGQEIIPWSEFGSIRVNSYQGLSVVITRKKPGGKEKKASAVSVDLLRAWVIPPIVEEHARRYAPA